MSPARRGLSLVELLIVVTLIATMMAMTLPMLSSANAKARSELCQHNLVEISQAVAGFTQDMNALPTLHLLSPTQPGLSLPEFIRPRLHTPHVTFCPSDETDKSHLLGTSYQWSSRFNGLHPGELGGLVGQPLIQDREAFHTGAARPTNEVLLVDDDSGRRLHIPGMPAQGADDQGSTLYLSTPPSVHDDQDDDDQDDATGQSQRRRHGQGNAHGHGNTHANPRARPHHH